MDAAVAAAATLAVVEPFGSGLGGGGFLLAYLAARREVVALDCRETAPAAATPAMFLDPGSGEPRHRETIATSGLAVGVPGQVRGWDTALRRWGRLPLARVLQPAIDAARDGFAVTPYFAQQTAAHRHRLARFPWSARRFLPHAEIPRVGSTFVQPELAGTLALLAARGADAFCAATAPALAAAVRAPHTTECGNAAVLRGLLTTADIVSYAPRLRRPLWGSYRGYRIAAFPPPSSGPTVLQALRLLEGFDLRAAGVGSAAGVHLLCEAFRVAHADRSRWLGDPDFAAIPTAGLISAGYAAERRRLIAPDATAAGRTPAGDPWPYDDTQRATTRGAAPSEQAAPGPEVEEEPEPEATSTTHLSVVDGEGNAVALTSTLAWHFGSALSVPERGFLLNNTLSNFWPRPSDRASCNLAQPGKRPRSSIAPVLLFDPDGHLRWVLGAAGGGWITPVVVALLVALVDWGLPSDEAVARGRSLPADWRGGVELEPALYDADAALVAGLEALGHRVTRAEGTGGAAQIVALDPRTGDAVGTADRRRDGAVAYAP